MLFIKRMIEGVLHFFDHKCEYCKQIACVEHAPVSDSRHTTYVIMACDCGNVVTFPEKNFLLTTGEHQKDIKDALHEKEYALIVERNESIDGSLHPVA